MSTIEDYIKQNKMPVIYTCSSQYNALLAFIFIMLYGKVNNSCIIMFSPEKRVLKAFYNISEKLNLYRIKNIVIDKQTKLHRALGVSNIRNHIIKKCVFKKMHIIGGDYFLVNFAWNPRIVLYPASIYFKNCQRCIFVEEGATQYVTPSENMVVLLLKKLYGNQMDFWEDERINGVFVQFPQKYSYIKTSIQSFSLKKTIEKLGDSTKKMIVDTFGMGIQLDELRKQLEDKAGIIFTQPLSEDGYISENEKKKVYSDIVNFYSRYGKLVVKLHPRDTSNYEFTSASIMKSDFPSELLSISGKKFEFAVALCSSAVETVDAKLKKNLNEKYLNDLSFNLIELDVI